MMLRRFDVIQKLLIKSFRKCTEKNNLINSNEWKQGIEIINELFIYLR